MKLLIVDDHVVVRQGVCQLPSSLSGISTYEASSAAEALGVFRTHRPDVVLLDLNLVSSSGFELLRRLLLEDKAVRVLVFSMHAEAVYVAHALKAGARGYVSKSATAEELLTAIRQVAQGGRYIEREIAAQLVFTQYSTDDPLAQLSTREVDILRLLGGLMAVTGFIVMCVDPSSSMPIDFDVASAHIGSWASENQAAWAV